MRDSWLVFVVRRDRKNLFIGLLLAFIFYQTITSHNCFNAWASSDNESLFVNNDKYEYAVVITSAPDNTGERAAIRRTWLKLASADTTIKLEDPKHNMVKFFFVIGTGGLSDIKKKILKQENYNYQDLLLFEDIVDSYNALTSKMLRTHKWISKNMKGLRYLIKTDDDSFVRIDKIVQNLENFAPSMDALQLKDYVRHQDAPYFKGLYWGYFNGRGRVFKSGKWQEHNWFLCDRYLPYALGGAYIISRNIVDYVAKNADDLSQYNSEDVSLGVWTASLDKINRVHDLRFDTSAKSRGCSNDMLVRHKVSTSEMEKVYHILINSKGEKMCEEEKVNNYYFYNWNVVPSACCIVRTE